MANDAGRIHRGSTRRTPASPLAAARFRRTLGLVLLIGAPLLAFGTWNATRQPLEVFALAQRNRAQLDSATYASAAYHAAFARATQANRWHLTGYATLGVLGTLVGAGLVYAGLPRAGRAPS